MSRKEKSVSLFEDVLHYERRKWTKVVVDDETLSSKDRNLVHECFALNALLWFDVIGERIFNKRELYSWVARLSTANLNDVLDVFEYTDTALISGWYDTTDQLLADIRTKFPGLGGLITPLRYRLDDFYASQRLGRADSLRDLRSCLLFTSRLTLTSFSKAKEESYEKYEKVMEAISVNETLPSDYMVTWVGDLYPKSEQVFLENFWPKHGNGSVAERSRDGKPLSELQKFQVCNTPAVRYALAKAGIMPLPLSPATTCRCSRISDVPKGIRKRRIICMEPANLMFLQQGVAAALDFRKTKLRKHVNLRDASLSRELAKLGSETGRYCTIDLSSASDSVRWNFVSALFAKRPYLQRWMALCRSTHREYPDGRVEKNYHFAPMGSALCFPVEVIVFSAICEEAIQIVGGKSNYQVYGDDIVIEERYYQTMIDLLIHYGFTPNLEKTFHGESPFREACGGHYFLGNDVTPLRISRRFSGLSSKSATSLAGIIDLSNRTYKVYYTLHDVLAHLIMKKTNYQIACTTLDSDSSKFLTDQVFPTVESSTDR